MTLPATAAAQQSLERRALVATVLSVALAILAQGYIAGREYLFDGLLLYGLALLIGARVLQIPFRETEDTERPPADAAVGPRELRISRATLLLGVISIGANLVALRLFGTNSNPTAAWALYAASVIGLPLTVWVASGRRALRPAADWQLSDVFALGLILLVAAAFRLYRLDSLPAGLWWDEGFNGQQILRIMNDPNYRPVFVPFPGQGPALSWYLTIPFFWVFGPNALGLRMGAVVGGLLGIVAVFLLGRELFGRRVGVVAGALLAVMAWDVNFSRIAFNSIWSVAFDALAAYFLIRGMRTGKPLSFALAGTMLGLGLNMYYSSRLVPFLLLLCLVQRFVAERRGSISRHLGGLLVFGFAALTAVSPLVQFAIQRPNEFNARVDSVTVLREVANTNSYAPLVENLRKHLLMFNYEGDLNGRHNLPRAPMLDPVTGALFVLGLLMAIRRIRRAEHLFLVGWLLVMLTGGVFSVTFEAPQGLRTIDEVTAVAILAALPVVSLWDRLRELRPGELRLLFPSYSTQWRQVAMSVATLPIIGLLTWIAAANYDRYFVRQATDFNSWSSFSTAETEIARQVNQLGPEYEVYVGETFTNHPTIEFLTRRKSLQRYIPAEQLPLGDAKNAAIFLEPYQTEAVALLRRLYPQAEIRSLRSPASDRPVLHTVILRQPQIAGIQGVMGSYYANVEGTGSPLMTEWLPYPDIDWRASGLPKAPFLAMWEATLAAPTYGRYLFRLEGPLSAELFVDGYRLVGGGGQQTVTLAKGTHALRIKAVVSDKRPIKLLWQPPDTPQLSLIPQERVFVPPVSNNGLLGSYYSNREWKGDPAFQQVDPYLDMRFHLLPLPRPYSVEWRGKIDVPRTGVYLFATESADISWVYVDDQLVATNEGANRQLREGAIRLEAGFHDLRVRYYDETGHTFIRVYWTPPEGERELLPHDRLFPPQGAYPPSLQLPSAPSPTAQPRVPVAPSLEGVKVEFGRPLTAGGALVDPRDVAVSPDGRVYVADTASKRVVILKPDGTSEGQLEALFAQPFGVAVARDGRVFVLDSLGKDPIRFFSPKGEAGGALGSTAGMYNPRGIFVDASGAVYVADTGRGRVVKLSASGEVVGEFRGGGRMGQPVSVTLDRDGNLYVVDSEKHQLWVLGPGDGVLRSWPIPPSSTFDAPHVALGPKGEIYVSNPGAGIVNVYDTLGRSLGQVGRQGSGEGQSSLPTGLRVDDQGRLWVADTGNKRVQQWVIR